jgi:hypothetical protein
MPKPSDAAPALWTCLMQSWMGRASGTGRDTEAREEDRTASRPRHSPTPMPVPG